MSIEVLREGKQETIQVAECSRGDCVIGGKSK